MAHPLIARDPKIMFGKACFVGTRIPVTVVLESLAAGERVEDILQGYPELTPTHISAALSYAAESVDQLVVME